ncbi:MAG: ABC transporter ATP-binding protein, partial [Anaerolineae bacterium]
YKHFDGVRAVDGLTFEVAQGEIFGLLGPNGAGKTTAIRVLMDIFKPDSGEVAVLGQPPGEARGRVGYLPEERGLYRNLGVSEVLVYLAELKGVPRPKAASNAEAWLRRVGLGDWGNRKVKDLSRGMGQKLQFVASVVHDPELVILDEPFQALDPLNVELVKTLIWELRERGATVLLSTHQMNLVEALCDRILLINRGKPALYGRLDEIKRRFAPNTVRLRLAAPRKDPPLTKLPGVTGVEATDNTYTLTLAPDVAPRSVLRTLIEREVEMEAFDVAPAPLDQIFIAVVGEDGDE